MRSLRLLIGTVAIALLAASAALAKTHAKAHAAPSPQQIFQSLYDQMDNAARKYNLDGAMADYSPQITFTDPGEPTYGLAEARRGTISFFHLERFIVPSTVITSVLPVGDGSYLVVATTRTTMKEPIGHAGRFEDRVLQETDQDYWAKEGGHWRIMEENEIGIHIWINGVQTM